MAVDTLEIAKKLEAAGVERRQAEAISESIRDGSKSDLDEAVTRLEAKIGSEISRLEAKIDTTAQRLEARIETKIAEFRTEVFRLMVGQVVVFSAIVALLRFLPVR
jgi:F0F1-type ATP synthase membrane subunit b/b'